MIRNNVVEEAKAWNKKHNKLIMMLEYGADTMEGLHIVCHNHKSKKKTTNF